MLVDGRPVSASLFDIALFLRWNGLAAGRRAAAGRTSTCRSSRAATRRELWNDVFIAAQEARRPAARDDPRDRPDRDDHGVVRDGGDPLRAARALARASTQAAGTTSSAPSRSSATTRRSSCRTAPRSRWPCRSCTPTPSSSCAPATGAERTRSAAWRPSSRAGGRDVQRAGVRRVREDKEREAGAGLRRHLGGASRSRAARPRDLRRGAGRPAEPEVAACARTSTPDGAALLALDRTPGEITLAGVQTNVSVGLRYLDSLAERCRRGGDRQPHGGRRDGRDLTRPAVAVDPP